MRTHFWQLDVTNLLFLTQMGQRLVVVYQFVMTTTTILAISVSISISVATVVMESIVARLHCLCIFQSLTQRFEV
jgi:hypothetical protein